MSRVYAEHGVRAYREGRCDCKRCKQMFLLYQAKERERARRRRAGEPEAGLPAATCRCDAPIGVGECLKCGKPVVVGATDAV